jgi:thiol-disulfide isomerase/thioredoxin
MSKKQILGDILTGVITSIISFFILESFKLSLALIAIAFLSVIAGFFRGKNPNQGILKKVVLMSPIYFLLIIPVLNGVFYLISVIVVVLTGIATGIYARRLLPKNALKALSLFSSFTVSVLLFSLILLPSWLDSMMWEKTNYKAPEFTLLTFDGDTIKSSDFNNKVIVIDFWATWCKPCIKQFPVIEKLYKENKDVAFFLIHTQKGGDTFEKALKFIKQSNYDLPFVSDVENMTYEKFNITSIPRLIIIDKKGVVKFTHTGYIESENLYKTFKKYLSLTLD